MKKILFAGAAALLTVTGFSSFKSAHTSGPYYFQVRSFAYLTLGSPVFQSETSWITGPGAATCKAAVNSHYICVIKATTTQVTGIGSNTVLKSSVTGQTVLTRTMSLSGAKE